MTQTSFPRNESRPSHDGRKRDKVIDLGDVNDRSVICLIAWILCQLRSWRYERVNHRPKTIPPFSLTKSAKSEASKKYGRKEGSLSRMILGAFEAIFMRSPISQE